jgi:type II secretory pathway component PulK
MKIRHSAARGSVLIIVLWISVGLAAIALTFAHTSIMAYKGADNEVAGQQAEWAIEGGVHYVISLLSNSATATPGAMLDRTSYESEALPLGEATIWLIGGSGDDTTYSTTKPVFGLVDEASKINVNMDKALLAQLLPNLPGMTEELASAILDWVDTDDNVTGNGAESETYSLRSPSYSSKNGPFESLEELALVNGATFEILYGEDANMNGVLDANEDDGEESAPADNADGKLEPGVLAYLTCFSRETNLASDGSARVNVGKLTNNLPLAALLNELGADPAAKIQANLVAYIPVPPANGGAPQAPGTFTSVMEFYMASGMTPEQFAQIGDRMWIAPAGNKSYVDGLININTASEAVLACIPGILSDKASAVVGARAGQTEGSTSIAWLRDVLGDENARLAGPFITGRSLQVSADIAAVGRHGRGYRRARFVIDTSTGTPRVVYRRDLSSLGWALGSDARQSLADRKEMAK